MTLTLIKPSGMSLGMLFFSNSFCQALFTMIYQQFGEFQVCDVSKYFGEILCWLFRRTYMNKIDVQTRNQLYILLNNKIM